MYIIRSDGSTRVSIEQFDFLRPGIQQLYLGLLF